MWVLAFTVSWIPFYHLEHAILQIHNNTVAPIPSHVYASYLDLIYRWIEEVDHFISPTVMFFMAATSLVRLSTSGLCAQGIWSSWHSTNSYNSLHISAWYFYNLYSLIWKVHTTWFTTSWELKHSPNHLALYLSDSFNPAIMASYSTLFLVMLGHRMACQMSFPVGTSSTSRNPDPAVLETLSMYKTHRSNNLGEVRVASFSASCSILTLKSVSTCDFINVRC